VLEVKKLRLRGASGNAEFSYGGAVVYPKSRAEAAALSALFGCGGAAGVSASAELADGTPLSELFAPASMNAEERFLSVYRPGEAYAARLAGYADPARFFPKKNFSALTDGAGGTAVFRRLLRERLRRFAPDEGSEKELLCFFELNSLWRDVEGVRDMHRVFPPLLLYDPPPGARFEEAAEDLDRQIFILGPNYLIFGDQACYYKRPRR
jgi:hypothetical protein